MFIVGQMLVDVMTMRSGNKNGDAENENEDREYYWLPMVKGQLNIYRIKWEQWGRTCLKTLRIYWTLWFVWYMIKMEMVTKMTTEAGISLYLSVDCREDSDDRLYVREKSKL